MLTNIAKLLLIAGLRIDGFFFIFSFYLLLTRTCNALWLWDRATHSSRLCHSQNWLVFFFFTFCRLFILRASMNWLRRPRKMSRAHSTVISTWNSVTTKSSCSKRISVTLPLNDWRRRGKHSPAAGNDEIQLFFCQNFNYHQTHCEFSVCFMLCKKNQIFFFWIRQGNQKWPHANSALIHRLSKATIAMF